MKINRQQWKHAYQQYRFEQSHRAVNPSYWMVRLDILNLIMTIRS